MEKTFISIADPSENTTQVILPSETTLLPNREVRETPKRVFVPKKSCKIRPIIFVRSKNDTVLPPEVRFWVITWVVTIGHVHLLRQASQKYLLSTLGLGIEPYCYKIGKVSQKLCPGKILHFAHKMLLNSMSLNKKA